MVFLLLPTNVMNIVIDFPVGRVLQVEGAQREARAGQVEEVECHVFISSMQKSLELAVASWYFSANNHLALLGHWTALGLEGLAESDTCSSHHASFFSLRQIENQMPFPEGLSEGYGS